MNNTLYRLVLLVLLLTFICAPFAGFAPLLMVVAIAGVYWFIASSVKILLFGEKREE